MWQRYKSLATIPGLLLLAALGVIASPVARPLPAQETAAPTAKPVTFLGSVQSIDGKTLTVKNDAGVTAQVTIGDAARLLRISPGQKTLAGATPVNLSDLQVGDRVLARGELGTDGKGIQANLIVLMKSADIAQKRETEQADWQKRGVGGLVTAVDLAAGTVTIVTGNGRSKGALIIRTAAATSIRRYAPGSVKYDDAKPASLSATKVGDQLIARGSRSADGQSMDAEEIVSGTFYNFAGAITAVDPAASTITVSDLATKKPVVVRVTAESELKKLDPAVAQRIAAGLQKAGAGKQPAAKSGTPPATPAPRPPSQGDTAAPVDSQQIIARAPAIALRDLQKGNMVMLVATQGSSPGAYAAVTLISGVEPMLQTSASGSQSLLSSSWNVSGSGGGGGGGEAAP